MFIFIYNMDRDLNHCLVYPMRIFMKTRHDSEYILLSVCMIFLVGS